MWKFIEKLRNLPEGSRKAVVLFSSAGITALILVSWLVFPVPHFGSFSDADKERKSAEGLVTPFSIIGGEVHQAAGGIKEKWMSLGGTAGILSIVSALKENITPGTATSTISTSTAASAPEAKQNREALSAQETFLADNAASSTNETAATTTAATSTISAAR